MEIVDEQVHRVLEYVGALNRHGVRPDPGIVNEFAMRPSRKRPQATNRLQSGAVRILEQFVNSIYASGFEESETTPGESYTEYLARLGWLAGATEIELTIVGRALLRALNTPALDEVVADLVEVVLDPANPFAYAQALSAVSNTPKALLVEPYFGLQQLMDIADFENVERVMVGPGLHRRDLDLLATGLGALGADQRPQVRIAKALHDRYLIPRGDGRVVMLGISLAGVGKKVSTITTLGDLASIALRDAHEAIWAEATPVVPKGG